MEVTPLQLVELTDPEVQDRIAILMRGNVGQQYRFCPKGEKYHLQMGCRTTSTNDTSFGLMPCPMCAVGNCEDIDEWTPPQTFYANTLHGNMDFYHVARMCPSVRGVTLQAKTMCAHCQEDQKHQMYIHRLAIMRPFLQQTMRRRGRLVVQGFSMSGGNSAAD